MTLFRIRQYGTTTWTTIRIADEEDEGLEEELAEKTRDMLDMPDLHVQEMNEDGKWEDLE